MATITHKVVRGDTLSALAKKYGTTVNAIAKLNNIKNVNRIYVGQVLYISGKPASSSSSSSSTSSNATSSNNAKITMFGLQADTDRTIFAVWEWGKSNTKEYQVEWDYYTTNGTWFTGSHSTVTHSLNLESTYNAPANATQVRFRVKPISTTYSKKVGNETKEYNYWTAAWTGFKIFNMNSLPPKEPPVPTIEIKDYTLTVSVDNVGDLDATDIEFDIIRSDNLSYHKGTAKIIYSKASFSCTVSSGCKYRARARSKRDNLYSSYSDYSSESLVKPTAPSGINSCKATSETSVYLSWYKVNSAETYDIEYATKKEYLGASNASTTINSIETTHYEITGLESGERYFFRVRAVNEKGSSAWTDASSVIIGTTPSAPTTWSSTTTAIASETVKLFWVHNSEDQSKETMAEVEVYYGTTKVTHVVVNKTPEDEDQKTSEFVLDTSKMLEGLKIKWRVRTAGITGVYGDWSVQRTIDVYAPPTLTLELLDKDDNNFEILESFPFYIRAVAGPDTQNPISFHTSIVAKDSYSTVDEFGNEKVVISGDEVLSEFYDAMPIMKIKIMPDKIDLHPNVEYEVVSTVAMDSGLTAEARRTFSVSWVDEEVVPNAAISIDKNTLTAHIRPFCEYLPDLYYMVEYTNQQYVKTDTILPKMEGVSVGFTTEDDIVYSGFHNNVLTHFCIRTATEPVPVPDVTLAVYRREYDGHFTEIGSGLLNENNTFVTDPHPALDYAKYRIVATSNLTGAVSFTDLPGVPVEEKSVIVQWDETWRPLDPSNSTVILDDTWNGSMLKIPYNIDISDSNTSDVTLVKYIGREHPVSYYGTQLGATATWNMVIPKSDTETLYAIRKLSIWLGDVYVREPSGSGYWANVSVSYNQTHRDMVIPISMNITRVIGGV